jgi:beta-glucosidase-like glycosyl hydrolase
MALEDLEKWLAPWERDKDGKKLDEPAEIDADRLKKYLHGLLADKEKLQETVGDRETELAGAKEQLTTLQREHEDDAARQAREQKERDAEFEKLRKEGIERRKVEAIEAAFEKEGITSARAKRLAKRIGPDVEEKDWVAEARELVEDGFRISDKVVSPPGDVEDEPDDGVSIKPVRRSSGEPVDTSKATGKKKSVADELNEAGILPNDY